MNLSFEFEGLTDMLPDFDEVSKEMLQAAAPVLVDKTKNAVKGVIKHDGESELVNSVKAGTAKKNKWGGYEISAEFKGESRTKTYRHSKTKRGKKHAVSNALKAIWKEYGIPGRGIPAQPFLEKAAKAAEDEAVDIMQNVFDEKVKI